jgi:hypothetical protein
MTIRSQQNPSRSSRAITVTPIVWPGKRTLLQPRRARELAPGKRSRTQNVMPR